MAWSVVVVLGVVLQDGVRTTTTDCHAVSMLQYTAVCTTVAVTVNVTWYLYYISGLPRS